MVVINMSEDRPVAGQRWTVKADCTQKSLKGLPSLPFGWSKDGDCRSFYYIASQNIIISPEHFIVFRVQSLSLSQSDETDQD